MSSTIEELEQKLNVKQMVGEHPWPALALAFGAGMLLSGSKADVKAAAATVVATRGAGSKLGSALDDVMANVMGAVNGAIQGHVDQWVNELKQAIGAPAQGGYGVGPVDQPVTNAPLGPGNIQRAD